MKTKELIRLLSMEDPSGEEEVCVGNVDFHFVSKEPAYYDGSLQVLERDESNQYYNIVGAKYKRTGSKVQIYTLSITDAIYNNTDMPVDYSELGSDRAATAKESHDKLRAWHNDMENKVECGEFVRWAKEEALKLTEDIESIESLATKFYQDHYSAKDELPKLDTVDGVWPSVRERRCQWSSTCNVVLVDGFIDVILR